VNFKTLDGITEIDGQKLIVMDDLRGVYPEKFNESGQMDYKWFEEQIRPNYKIYVRRDVASLSFTFQTEPIHEGGQRGCQLTTLIETALIMLKYFQKEMPCRENALSITKLEEALMWQEKRTKEREARGVEGTYKE
jgi:hypothetical protein